MMDDRGTDKENMTTEHENESLPEPRKEGELRSNSLVESAMSSKAKGKQKLVEPEDERLPENMLEEPDAPPPGTNEADPWDPVYVKKLATKCPDKYWVNRAAPRGEECKMLSELEGENLPRKCGGGIPIGGNIYGLKLSPDGTVLAVFSSRPYIPLYMALKPFAHIKNLFDDEEKQLDEYYTGVFSPDSRYVAVGGKHKNRAEWNDAEEDYEVLPCPVKIFDITNGKVVARLEVHEEEVMSIRGLFFKGDFYYLTTSQDGSIWKWKMDKDYKTLVEKTKMDDDVTCMAFNTSFLPGTGNKYFLAACDDVIMLFDFESARCLQTFKSTYSEYCENVQFVHAADYPDGFARPNSPVPQFAYFTTRGVEVPEDEIGNPSVPNFCTLNKLCYPQKKGGKFTCEVVRRFENPSYLSNYWLVKAATNGRYLLAPQQNGKLACFDLLTGNAVWIIKMQDEPLRRVVFHPYAKLAYTGGDGDGVVFIWGQGLRKEEVLKWKRVEGENLPEWAKPPPPKSKNAGSSRATSAGPSRGTNSGPSRSNAGPSRSTSTSRGRSRK